MKVLNYVNNAQALKQLTNGKQCDRIKSVYERRAK